MGPVPLRGSGKEQRGGENETRQVQESAVLTINCPAAVPAQFRGTGSY